MITSKNGVKALEFVCSRTVNERKSTSRTELHRRFEDRKLVEDLVKEGYIVIRSGDDYIPTPFGFEECGDVDILGIARGGFCTTIKILRNLYLLPNGGGRYIPFGEFVEFASRTNDFIYDGALRTGLTIAAMTGFLASYGGDRSSVDVSNFSISEVIIDVKNPLETWAAKVEEFRGGGSETQKRALTAVFPVKTSGQALIPQSWNFELLHPEIQETTRRRLQSGHFGDAVLAAFTCIDGKISSIVKRISGAELHGTKLMDRAFSTDKPILKLGDETETGKNIRLGYIKLFSGAVSAFRNPNAHNSSEMDAAEAVHSIHFASLLRTKLDECEIIGHSASQSEIAGRIPDRLSKK